MADDELMSIIRRSAKPLHGEAADYDALLALIGDARFVLLGEATHGTHEFYQSRAEITQRLIREKGFNTVAVEADWPDAYRVNRYVRGIGTDVRPTDALGDFKRFPLWMWRNEEVLELIQRLRDHNETIPAERRVGFYGLDLYSMYRSIAEVIAYLERVDPEAVKRAHARYRCFDHFGEEGQQYGFETSMGLRPDCEDEAIQQLIDLQRQAAQRVAHAGMAAADEQFYAEQNARLIKNAEEYYRGMFSNRVNTWNLRDRHMADTLDALADHLGRTGRTARIVVWEHNSHVGDARATDRADVDEINVGQVVRERHGNEAVLVGFTTHTGTVAAASEWGAVVERKRVRPSRPDSYEYLMHGTERERFFLSLRSGSAAQVLRSPRLERAIGVIYLPETERVSHYFRARLPEQFDAIFHFDETRALTPLDFVGAWAKQDLPETYPFGE